LSCCDLPRATPRALAGDDNALIKDLATPDSPGLRSFQCGGKTGHPGRAIGAERFCLFQVTGTFREEQVRIPRVTREVFAENRIDERVRFLIDKQADQVLSPPVEKVMVFEAG